MTATLARPASSRGSEPLPRADAAVAALRAGRPVLLAGGEEGGSVVVAAALAGARSVAWAVRHSSGFLTVALPPARAAELALPRAPASGRQRPRQTVAVDAASGVTTGISAADRARTARVLADPASSADDLRRPGHLVPITVAPGGVLEHAAAPEAALELCRSAGPAPAALVAALEPRDGHGQVIGRAEVSRLGRDHGLVVVGIEDVVTRRLREHDEHDEHADRRVRVSRGPSVALPTEHGPLEVIGYRDELTGAEHLAVRGSPGPRVTVHPECAAAVLGARSCACRRRLDADLVALARDGGTLIYLRGAQRWSWGLGGPCPGPLAGADDPVAAAVLADLDGLGASTP